MALLYQPSQPDGSIEARMIHLDQLSQPHGSIKARVAHLD